MYQAYEIDFNIEKALFRSGKVQETKEGKDV